MSKINTNILQKVLEAFDKIIEPTDDLLLHTKDTEGNMIIISMITGKTYEATPENDIRLGYKKEKVK